MELKIYKRGQAAYTRLFTSLTVFFIVAVGCYRLYDQLRMVGNPWIEVFVPAGIAAAAAAFLAWLSNRPSMADFFIAAEGEIKKVRWSSRKEIVASTTIVVIVVFVFSVLLFAADFFFAWLFMDTLNIY